MDTTYTPVHFAFIDDVTKKEIKVRTLEEKEYPQFYGKYAVEEVDEEESSAEAEKTVGLALPVAKEQHISFEENQRGVSFDILFGPYLSGATEITVTDPYIRLFYQIRNLMEFIETVVKYKSVADEIRIKLITVEDEFKSDQQVENFQKIQESCAPVGIDFQWEFADSHSIHARHIQLDNGWKILLDRGLDIFQHYEMNNSFSLSNRLQEYRQCKAFEVTNLKLIYE